MNTLWAIEVTPLIGKGKPFIEYTTICRNRRAAWDNFIGTCTPERYQEIKRRQRKGLLRAVKVTIQIAKDQS